ncbi:MAG TPA: hypothetical protein VLA16_24260 [Ideonella sp.]|nr:hypothetical protein [Ideonella sp.]
MSLDGHAALWLTVVALGAYHGLNPAMGWPLAVANGLSERRGAAVFKTLLPLGGGHLLAMAVVLVPFAMLSWYVAWSREIRIAAGLAVLAYGAYKLLQRRHPRFMARVPPTQLAWWSFLMATTHGAGLMLVPVALGLCEPSGAGPVAATGLVEAGHAGLMAWMRSGVGTAVAISLVHTLAMVAAGLAVAWGVYRYLGLRFLKQAWFNLDLLWGASLVLAGAVGAGMAW